MNRKRLEWSRKEVELETAGDVVFDGIGLALKGGELVGGGAPGIIGEGGAIDGMEYVSL
jgi:hypothetical protein